MTSSGTSTRSMCMPNHTQTVCCPSNGPQNNEPNSRSKMTELVRLLPPRHFCGGLESNPRNMLAKYFGSYCYLTWDSQTGYTAARPLCQCKDTDHSRDILIVCSMKQQHSTEQLHATETALPPRSPETGKAASRLSDLQAVSYTNMYMS